jgi:Uma2 family endonuclease
MVTTYRFTVDEYRLMGEAGIFHEDDRVELIDGEIVEMSPIGNPHIAELDRLNRVMSLIFGRRAIVRVQSPIKLGEHTEPEPDLLLLRDRADFYRNGGAGADDVLLVIEVADSSLDYDRNRKAALYAQFGLPEYWLFDLQGDQLLVHREPMPTGYRYLSTLRRGESIRPVSFPDDGIPVVELLGPA